MSHPHRLTLALGLLLLVGTAEAQDPGKDIIIAVKPGLLARERIAIPEGRVLPRPDPVLQKIALELRDVMWDDLRYSGVFEMVPKELYASVKTPPRADGGVAFEEWVAIGTSWLVLLDVSSTQGEMVLEGRLYETKIDRKLVLGKRYQARMDLARRVAHSFADAIIGQVGGEPGVCNTQIAFASDRDGGKGHRELFVSDYDGHAPRRLTGNGKLNMSPDWGPANAEIAFMSYLKGNPDLYLLTRSSGAVRPLWSRPGLNSSPAWSPDGQTLAFASSHQGGDTEIYLISPQGTGLKRLTASNGIDTNPAWSPSGTQLSFTSDRSGSTQIWVMDADGLNLRKLTTQGLFSDGAAWAPARGSRTRIAFAGRSAGLCQIYVYTVETGEFVQLTDEGWNESPSWSPDGRQIAFASTRGGRSDIYVMNDDGTNQRRISSGGNNVTPAWSHR